MERHELTSRQMTVWLAAAMSAPLAHFSGAGWVAVGLAALAMLPLTLLPREGWGNLGERMRMVEFLWLSAAAGLLLENSGVYWPASQNEVFVPLTLLVLAVLTKLTAAPRVGTVVGMCLAVLYLPVLFGGAAQVELRWLAPASDGMWSGPLLITFLLPALAGIWRREKQGRGQTLALCGGIGVLFGLLTQGILSPHVAAGLPDAFHQMGRSMRLGSISRIEPIVAVAVTLGWYALCSFLLSSAVQLAKGTGMGERTAVLAAAAIAAGVILARVQLPDAAVVILSLFLWVLVPACTPKKKFAKK